MLTNDAANDAGDAGIQLTAYKREKSKRGVAGLGGGGGRSREDEDKRFTFSKSNGDISHRKAKDTQPQP